MKKIPKKTGGNTRPQTPRLFDLVFKRLIRLSPGAIVRFINGLFGSSHPTHSAVDYPNTETVSGKLRHLLSDTVILIALRSTYHIEVQTKGDSQIAIRVFEYGLAQALRTQTTEDSIIHVKFPEARLIYLSPSKTTPDELTLRLEFPGGNYDYTVKTFKPLEWSVKDLEKKNMFILLPFYVLKLRAEARKAGTAEKRKALGRRMKALVGDIVDAIEDGVRAGSVTEADGQIMLEHMERLFRELYTGYTELKESNIMLQDRLLTYSEEVAIKVRRQTKREEAKRYRKLMEKIRRETELKMELKTAKKMKELKFSAKKIAAVSGLSLAEIAKL
jgi:hypothetical protein